jgi:hypothetical protein
MPTPKQQQYRKAGEVLVRNPQNRHFEAYYCDSKEEALQKALSLIPSGSSVGWGGATSAIEIGLLDALRKGDYIALDRDRAASADERSQIVSRCLTADVFITGANALSLDGQMVNIDGAGNRTAAIIYGPKSVLVIAGMNKVCDSIESAVARARTVAAPVNNQRFVNDNPCQVTGTCANCKNVTCICNHIVVTRHCRPVNRIKFILVGEDLGF